MFKIGLYLTAIGLFTIITAGTATVWMDPAASFTVKIVVTGFGLGILGLGAMLGDLK